MQGFFIKITYTIIYQVFIAWPKTLLEGVEKMILKMSSQELLNFVLLGGKEQNSLGMPPLLFYFSIVSGFLICLLLLSNFIAAQLSHEPITMKQKIVESLKNATKGGVIIVVIPLAFLILNLVAGVLQNLLTYGVNKFNANGEKQGTITQIIHDMGWIGKGKGAPSWNDFESNYNPVIVVFGMVFFAINLFKLALILMMRLFELTLLYMMSPFVASKMTTDGGGAFRRWKEITIGKFLMVLGIVLSIAITMTTINTLSRAVDQGTFDLVAVMDIEKIGLKLFIVLAGSTFMLLAHQYIVMITGSETALAQGQLFATQMGQVWQGMKGAGYLTGKSLGFAKRKVNKNLLNSAQEISADTEKKSPFSFFRKGLSDRTGLLGGVGVGLVTGGLAFSSLKNSYKSKLHKINQANIGNNGVSETSKRVIAGVSTLINSPFTLAKTGLKLVNKKTIDKTKNIGVEVKESTYDVAQARSEDYKHEEEMKIKSRQQKLEKKQKKKDYSHSE